VRNGSAFTRWALIGTVTVALLVAGTFLRWDRIHVVMAAEPVAHIGGFVLTNTILAGFLAVVAASAFVSLAMRNASLVPGRLQGLLEFVVEGFLNLCVSVAGPKHGRQFFPLVTSFFIFIITCNWMGLLPGYLMIGLQHESEGQTEFVPLLRSATTDLNTTIGLALVSVIATQIYGVRALGVGGYFGRFVNLKQGPLGLYVGILEAISEVMKIISLSFRLFGNLFAGEVLLSVIGFLVPLLVTIPFLGLEVFVGGIQAFVFALLTLVFSTLAVTSHEAEHTAEAGAHH
jgi:F-type H+-transporting ATPase subunit a